MPPSALFSAYLSWDYVTESLDNYFLLVAFMALEHRVTYDLHFLIHTEKSFWDLEIVRAENTTNKWEKNFLEHY